MPKTRNLSTEKRAAVVTLSEEGLALKLLPDHNVVVQAPLRPRKMVFFHTSLSVRRETPRTLKNELEDATGVDITTRTVRRKLLKSGLRGCVAAT